jgi:hypothetical protein
MIQTSCAARCFVSLVAALVFVVSAKAQDKPASSRSTRDSTSTSAPVGHRQPTAADVTRVKPMIDPEQEKRERELDKKLQICRGC